MIMSMAGAETPSLSTTVTLKKKNMLIQYCKGMKKDASLSGLLKSQ